MQRKLRRVTEEWLLLAADSVRRALSERDLTNKHRCASSGGRRRDGLDIPW